MNTRVNPPKSVTYPSTKEGGSKGSMMYCLQLHDIIAPLSRIPFCCCPKHRQHLNNTLFDMRLSNQKSLHPQATKKQVYGTTRSWKLEDVLTEKNDMIQENQSFPQRYRIEWHRRANQPDGPYLPIVE